jgi:hypothetical protein
LTEVCSTCNKPYRKNEVSFCSNGFHCCRDCTWEEGQIVGRCFTCWESALIVGFLWKFWVLARKIKKTLDNFRETR